MINTLSDLYARTHTHTQKWHQALDAEHRPSGGCFFFGTRAHSPNANESHFLTKNNQFVFMQCYAV